MKFVTVYDADSHSKRVMDTIAWIRKPISSTLFVSYMLDIVLAGYRNLDRRLMALDGSKEGKMDRIRGMVLSTPTPISKSDVLALCRTSPPRQQRRCWAGW